MEAGYAHSESAVLLCNTWILWYQKADHQRTYREQKRRIEKEIQHHQKRTKEVTDEIIELLPIPKARIYPWISLGLHRHTLGNMTYKCNECGSYDVEQKLTNRLLVPVVFYTFRIHGEMYHRIGSLLPNSETQPQFAQIYIYDTDHEIQNRLNIMPGLDPMILGELQQMLHNINPYVNQFRQAGNLLKHNPSLDLKLVITNNRTKDPQRYNTPNASEVAAIMIGNGQEIEHQNRDIVLQPHEGNIKRISELHCAYTPLYYVLMFPRVLEIYSDNDETDEKYVTAMNYFAYRLQIGRSNEATTYIILVRLFQQWNC
ncbi:unnamed protein product [Rhizophagus irregularis]|nr:unnamed protein product [Rhizophagus irregularis]